MLNVLHLLAALAMAVSAFGVSAQDKRRIERVAPAASAADAGGDRWALIVGVDQYQTKDIPPLSGAVADDTERVALLNAAKADDHRVTAALRLGGTLPVPPAVVGRLVSAALSAKVSEVTATIHNGQVAIAARVPDEARATAVRDAVKQAANGLQITDRVEVGPSESTGELNVEALHDSINRLVNGNGAIRFVQGTTGWEGHGPVLVERVGRMLLVAPRASVTLVAHGTDPAMATKRAEMVRDVLVGQGVSPALIALETRPAPDGEYDPATRQVDVVVR